MSQCHGWKDSFARYGKASRLFLTFSLSLNLWLFSLAPSLCLSLTHIHMHTYHDNTKLCGNNNFQMYAIKETRSRHNNRVSAFLFLCTFTTVIGIDRIPEGVQAGAQGGSGWEEYFKANTGCQSDDTRELFSCHSRRAVFFSQVSLKCLF